LIFFLQLPSLEPLKIEVISGDFSSDWTLICQYFSEATSVKLVYVLNNNFYLRSFL
jgi:hypothetical protein